MISCGPLSVYEARRNIQIDDTIEIFEKVTEQGGLPPCPHFLFESRSINPLYGRMSLMGFDPLLEINGTEDTVRISITNQRGKKFFDAFLDSEIIDLADQIINRTETEIILRIKKDEGFLAEEKRSKRKNITSALRKFLEYFECEEKNLFGVFGAFSYDFARLFENLPNVHPQRSDIPEFRFFLFDSFIRQDLIQEKSEIICYRTSEQESRKAIQEIEGILTLNPRVNSGVKSQSGGFSTSNITCDTSKKEYEDLVRKAKELAEQGELFEIVFSRKFTGDFEGSALELYKIYRQKNPAPYLFYFNFGEDQLVGASPEMMVRVESGKTHLRPISGTRPRGEDPISDHENELELLSCKKERAELDMLIDLGRNDLKRVCQTGIEITDYRHVEKYSRVMHTIAHLTGKLKPEYTALDAIIACQSAGTLTGAPKVQAMIEIEKYEKARRGYYGGSIGYLTFGGDMDTGIIIRTAHIANGKFELRVGATLLYDSIPEDEYKETDNKAQALLEILNGDQK